MPPRPSRGRPSARARGSAAPSLRPGDVRPLPPRNPRLFALDLADEAGRATALQAAMSNALEAGRWYRPEKRPFWPHLTLARVKRGERRVPGLAATPPPAGPSGLRSSRSTARRFGLRARYTSRWNGLTSSNVSYTKDPRVDAYIDPLPEWQQQICRRVRDLIHAADPEIEETIKRRVQPYFVLEGNVCALLATKDHVNVFLYDGAIVPDPEGIITAGHDNKTGRMIAIYEGEPINERALVEMFRRIIANNRAGGWRKIKAARGGA